MTATVQLDNYPTPGLRGNADASAFAVSGALGPTFYARQPDPQVRPRRWSVAWFAAPGQLADHLRRHWAEHSPEEFTWTPPGGLAPVVVVLSAPPSIRWSGRGSAQVDAELEEVQAHE